MGSAPWGAAAAYGARALTVRQHSRNYNDDAGGVKSVWVSSDRTACQIGLSFQTAPACLTAVSAPLISVSPPAGLPNVRQSKIPNPNDGAFQIQTARVRARGGGALRGNTLELRELAKGRQRRSFVRPPRRRENKI